MVSDVIIIGGGIVGLSCAYRLAKDGLKVTLLERGRCGQQASWAGAGIIAPCSWHRSDDLARIHMEAVFGYHEFAAELHECSGIDPLFRRCGEFHLILDDNRMKMATREVQAIGERTTPEGRPIAKTLTPEEARELEPNLAGEMLGVQHGRMSAQVRTPRLLEALRECCVALGVRIEEGCEVRALLKDGERVLGVQTQQGEATADVTADATVLCAGAWSSQLDPLLAEHMPVHPVRGQIVLLKMPDPPIRHIISLEEEHFYMVARDDGHVLVGSTEEHDSAFNNRNTAQAVARLSALAIKYVPILSGASVVRTWAGLRPGTPDRRPFLGFVPGLSNFIAATGNFRTGLATAPIVADIVADLLQKGMCQYNLAKAAPGREYPN